MKTIITDNPYPDALNDIQKITPIRYRWNRDDTGVQIGLSAQSVLPIIPEAISTHATLESEGDATEYYTLRYTEVIPLVVSSIQQLTARVAAQNSRIEALEALVQKLLVK